MQDFIVSECRAIAENFSRLVSLAPAIEAAAKLCAETIRGGGKVLFCGNGGSAADAQHLAAELVGRYEKDRPAMAAVALTTDTSVLTAVSNDYCFEESFSRQVCGLGRRGDVLYAISTSGNSSNVIRAIVAAKEVGMQVIAVTGQKGGKMRDCCDVLIDVPSDKACHIQEMHIAVGHMICGLVEQNMAS